MNRLKSSEEKLSKEEWFNYIEAWEKSGKSQTQFCEENNLSYGVFGYWRTAYLKKKVVPVSLGLKAKPLPSEQTTPQFISVKPTSSVSCASGETLQARYPSGLTLNLPLSFPIEKMLLILQGLE